VPVYFEESSRVWSEVHPGVFRSVLHRYDTGGGAALFRLDPGAQMPEHEHPSGEHGYVIAGTGVFGDRTLSAGDAFWMEIHERHNVRALTALLFIAVSAPRTQPR
jgi:quercetin dioxygenase-like cupin family protein